MAATLFDVTHGSLVIKQIQSYNFSPGNRLEAGRGSAALQASERFLVGGEPRLQVTTSDVATVMAALDEISGLSVANGNVKIHQRVRTVGGSYATGSDIFLGGTACYGTMIPVTLNAQGGNIATLDVEACYRSSDGFTPPLAYTGSQSAGTAGYTNSYQLGPTEIDSSQTTSIVGITVNFGISMEVPPPTDGGIWPQEIYINRVDPFVDVRFRNQGLLDTHGPLFSDATSAVFSLIQKAAGGTITALTESEHITITLDGGIKSVENVSGQDVNLIEPTLRIHCAGLTVATAQALAEE